MAKFAKGVAGNPGGRRREELVRELVKERIRSDPRAARLGLDESWVDSLTPIQLAGVPEFTVATIVESYASLKTQRVPDDDIFQQIEAHRSMIGVGDMPEPLTLESYIRYRVSLDHHPRAPASEDAISNAIRVFRKRFSC